MLDSGLRLSKITLEGLVTSHCFRNWHPTNNNQECVCSIVSFIRNVCLCASLKKSFHKDLHHTEMLSNFKETEPTVQRYSLKNVTDDRRLTERVPADPPRN